MSTITIDEKTRIALEANATARGLSLTDYLRHVARSEPSLYLAADDARQQELRRRMKECIAQAANEPRQPNRPQGISGEFADAMFEKYRR